MMEMFVNAEEVKEEKYISKRAKSLLNWFRAGGVFPVLECTDTNTYLCFMDVDSLYDVELLISRQGHRFITVIVHTTSGIEVDKFKLPGVPMVCDPKQVLEWFVEKAETKRDWNQVTLLERNECEG